MSKIYKNLFQKIKFIINTMDLKSFIKRNHFLSWCCYSIFKKYKRLKLAHGKLNILRINADGDKWKGIVKIQKHVLGKNNRLVLNHGCRLCNTVIHIIGNNNEIVFGENVKIGPKCSFWIEGNNCKINIGAGSTFTQIVHVNAQEDNSEISIGEDCMLSNHIIIRTSDSHPIYDLDSNKRINPAKSIQIGKHVWIAPHSTVMKGVIIGDGAIIGSNTIVTKQVPGNSLAVGMPARVVKTNIRWTRENIIFEK